MSITMTEVNLGKYIVAGYGRNRYGSNRSPKPCLRGFRQGQSAAKELDIKQYVGKPIVLTVSTVFGFAEVTFLSGLLRPLIRKQGLDETIKFVTATHNAMRDSLSEFFAHEDLRAKEKIAKQVKEASLGKWSEPSTFFVPDIGTVVRLAQDWSFRLHVEYRNIDLVDYLGIPRPRTGWGRYGSKPSAHQVILKQGTILKVDRVYIRKGAKEYSSLTFNIQKGGDSAAIFEGNLFEFQKKGYRFWVKLSDVNQMAVEVDQATLAEN